MRIVALRIDSLHFQ